MPVYYIDTSALVKRYHLEQGSDRVDQIFADPASILSTANLTITELTSALDRKLQGGLLSKQGLTHVLSVAARDLLEEFWLIELGRDHIRRSQNLILGYHLRTLDALHFAVLLSLKELEPILVSADQRLLSAAQQEGLQILNPEV